MKALKNKILSFSLRDMLVLMCAAFGQTQGTEYCQEPCAPPMGERPAIVDGAISEMVVLCSIRKVRKP